MSIDYYMNKLHHYSFNREQLDIIDKGELLGKNITKVFFISLLILLFLSDLISNEIISTLLLGIIIFGMIGYILFLIFRKKFILRKLKESIRVGIDE